MTHLISQEMAAQLQGDASLVSSQDDPNVPVKISYSKAQVLASQGTKFLAMPLVKRRERVLQQQLRRKDEHIDKLKSDLKVTQHRLKVKEGHGARQKKFAGKRKNASRVQLRAVTYKQLSKEQKKLVDNLRKQAAELCGYKPMREHDGSRAPLTVDAKLMNSGVCPAWLSACSCSNDSHNAIR